MPIFEINFFGLNVAPTYYGLMYAISFLLGYIIVKKRTINIGFLNIKLIDDLLFYIFLGVILGGRIGYVLFYNFGYFLDNLGDIVKLWEGGMSFHGGVLGVIIAMLIFSYKKKLNFYKLSDEITAVLPIGLGLGRIGNYLNRELLGFSPYYGPFNIDGYFPSTLLEFFLEGIVLLIILNFIYRKKQFNGQIASFFLIFYGFFRIFVEVFFRLPDNHIGYIYSYFTLGEILSLPMIIFGIYFYMKLKSRQVSNETCLKRDK